jgi:hypothetical protein
MTCVKEAKFKLMEFGLLPVTAYNLITGVLNYFDLLEPSRETAWRDSNLIETAKSGMIRTVSNMPSC